jgi:hypothetical protein
VFGYRGQNVYSELVGVRVIDGNELDTAFHQSGDKGQVSGQAIQLGNNKPCFVFLAGCQCRRELLPIAVLATLNLDKLLNQRPPAPVEIVQNRLALCLNSCPRP